MKNKIIIIALFATTVLFAQEQEDSILLVKETSFIKKTLSKQQKEIETLTKRMRSQSSVINKQKIDIDTLLNKNNYLHISIDSLKETVQNNSKQIITNSNELGTKIEKISDTSNYKISELSNSLDKKYMYWIIATLGTFLFGCLLYLLLGKRIKLSKRDVELQIKNTKTVLEEESIKLDNKLIGVLETQLKLKQEETRLKSNITNDKTDHSLALKVADEVIRIQKNLSRMDESTKGLKQLKSSVKRIQDNFVANGYELVEMLGKEYNEGMKVTANFIQSDALEVGRQIISRIIKPQVNFKGEMIQAAQIEVNVGE